MLGKFCPSGAVGIEQAFNQGWGQRGGGEQYAAAEQAGTMYKAAEGWQIVDAEVVGFSGERTYLMPSAELHGLLPNARVVPSRRRGGVEVGEGLLGRVIDSDGVPLDGRGPIRAEGSVSLAGMAIIAWQVPRWEKPQDGESGGGSYAEVWRHPYFRRMAPIGFVR